MKTSVREAAVTAGEYKATEKGETHHQQVIGLRVKSKARDEELLMISKSNAQALQAELKKLLRCMI